VDADSVGRVNEVRPEDVQASFCASVVDQWVRCGVSAAMIAPGSRSTPMALALVAHPDIEVSVFLDERSAAFAGLGWGVATGRPAVILCTSGTAATHFHGAVVESSLSGVPLIVVTADRPPELKDVGAPQTIDQTKLFGDAVRWFHEPGVPTLETRSRWRPMAARIHAASTGTNPGPVHVNLAFREPLVGSDIWRSDADESPTHSTGRLIPGSDIIDEASRRWSNRRGLLIVGRGGPDAEHVEALSTALGWPVLADSRSGAQSVSRAIVHFDSIVRTDDPALRPEVVVRFGEAPSSKALGRFLADESVEQWHVSGRPSPFDPDGRTSREVTVDPNVLIDGVLASVQAVDPAWSKTWTNVDTVARSRFARLDDVATTLSGPSVARAMVRCLPHGSNLVVSSSMPIRDLEWFAGDCSHLRVHSNRGANGIDGVLATAIGVALATGRTTGVLIGDVAFVHDSSSLAALRSRGIDLRVIVTDNDGGGIFHHLPQRTQLGGDTFETLFGTPHGTDLVAMAAAFGLDAASAGSMTELNTRLGTRGPTVTVVATDRDVDVDEHRRLHASIL